MSAVPQPPKQQQTPQLTDVKTLREQARRHIEEGAVTENYAANRDKVIELLNEALATELVCVLRYRHDYFMARGIHSQAVAAEFLEHSNEELAHADEIAERIVQLGGEPDFNPNALTGRSHAEYRIGKTLQEAVKENLVAERIAIDSYREMIQFVGDSDPTTRRMLEGILATEEDHADELADLLQQDQARGRQ
jgi:bacterioferritin